MSQITTLEETVKEQLEFKMKVKHEKKPTSLLNTAKLISKDLRVKIKNVNVLFETHKKAFLIEQIQLSEKKMISTIIQETTSKAWVQFEVVHEKDVELKTTFTEVKRMQRDIKIMMYPLWFVIAIMAVIEGILLKKTLFDKDIIILSRDDWRVILWIGVSIILMFALMFLYIHRLNLHEGYFQIIGLDFVSEQTADFYMISKRIGSRNTETFRYTLTCTCFRGYYTHPDKPEKLPFKKERKKLKDVEAAKHNYLLASDDLRLYQEEEVKIAEEIEDLRSEERELNIVQQQQKKQIRDKPDGEEIEEEIIVDLPFSVVLNESDDALVILKTMKEEKQTEQSAIQTLISQQKEIVQTLRQTYLSCLEDIYDFDDKELQKIEMSNLIDAFELNQSYRRINSQLNNRIIHLNETVGGLYDTMSQYQFSENQRVSEESSRRTSTKYSYELVGVAAEDQITTPVSSTGVSTIPSVKSRRVPASVGINTGIIQILAVMLGFSGVTIAVIEMVKALSQANPFIIIVVIISLPLTFLVIYKFVSWATQYFSHSQMSVRTT